MNYETIETVIAPGVALIWLNRPDLRNAMNDTMIAELTDAIEAAIDDESIRAIVLAGRGKAFCAGGDLNWMKRANEMTPEEAFEDSRKLAKLLRTIHDSPKPVIARVHGAAFAGGMGLVAACDIAVASHEARFCLSEVKLGLIPATISPYVIRAMGARASHRWFLTAERFDAAEAHRIGFVHAVVTADQLEARVAEIARALVSASPAAVKACKRLVQDVAEREIVVALVDQRLDRRRRVRVVALAPDHPATRYVDIVGSVSVACYLLWTGLRTAQPHLLGTKEELKGA